MTEPKPRIKVHGTPLSGHTHRVELLLRMLGIAFESVPAPAPVRRSAAFRALNAFQQIPVLQDGDLVLTDSNAILVYLAKTYDRGGRWLPEEPVAAAHVQRWLSIAAGEVKYGPATARMALQWNMAGDPVRAKEIAEELFRFMDEHLRQRTFLAADHATVADLACYSYIAHAEEGAVALDPYPALCAWLRRVESLPNFAPMPRSPIPAAAPA